MHIHYQRRGSSLGTEHVSLHMSGTLSLPLSLSLSECLGNPISTKKLFGMLGQSPFVLTGLG